MGRFSGDLGHPDGVKFSIETIEGHGMLIQLIPEYEDQVAERWCHQSVRAKG
jgi:hypothetical protein